MKKFLFRLGLFLLIPLALIVSSSIILPPTPRAKTSLLFSKLDKDRLLEDAPAPRLILVGGSNIPYGMDSSLIEKELDISTIDTGIHANLGAKYILDTVLSQVQSGDVVVVIMEYQQYFGSQMYGGEELLRMVFDVDRSTMKDLGLIQWINILKYFPKYAISKITPSEYNYKSDPYVTIYERAAFNDYGDVSLHWERDRVGFAPFFEIDGDYNWRLLDLFIEFEGNVAARGGKVFFSYPALESTSFRSIREDILIVEEELSRSSLRVLGTPRDYRLDDSLFYDTPYHLIWDGVFLRTSTLIEQLNEYGIEGER